MKRGTNWWFWISSLAFVALTALVAAGLVYPPDAWVLRAAQTHTSEFLDVAGTFLSVPGGAEFSGVAIVSLAGFLFFTGRWRLAGRLIFAFAITGVLELALKTWLPAVPVPPEAARSADPTLVEVPYPYPYPSGHTLRSVIIFGALYLLWPNRVLRAAVVAILAGVFLSRVYVGVHWPSDVLGGALLGVAGLAWAFSNRSAKT